MLLFWTLLEPLCMIHFMHRMKEVPSPFNPACLLIGWPLQTAGLDRRLDSQPELCASDD